jgi:hypothetical protein
MDPLLFMTVILYDEKTCGSQKGHIAVDWVGQWFSNL